VYLCVNIRVMSSCDLCWWVFFESVYGVILLILVCSIILLL